MKQHTKQQPLLKRKPLKGGQLNRQVKFSNSTSTSTKQPESILQPTQFKPSIKSKIKQYESIENVSLIQGSSFISNKQDGSMDSMDKMIIGVSAMGIGQKQFEEDLEEEDVEPDEHEREDRYDRQEKSKGAQGIDLDFNQIHKQYEKLIGRHQLLGQQQQQISDEVEENSRVLLDQDDWQIKKSSFSLSPQKKSSQNYLKQCLLKVQQKLQEIKPKKIQDNSNNSIKILVGNLGNLSQIHEQRQNNLNISDDIKRKINNNEQDQQQFIDFVRQPDPQSTNHQNLHENQNQNQGDGDGDGDGGLQVEGEGIVNQWQQSPMFEHHLELELQNQKQSKKTVQKKHITTNYQQILEALNSKQQAETPTYTQIPTKKQLNTEFLEILKIRENWIKLHHLKSEDWKKKELGILRKMRLVMVNPFCEWSQDQEKGCGQREEGQEQ